MDACDAALYYASLGLSVVPVKGDKKPLLKWAEFQRRIADPDEIESWYRTWPGAGVGIVAGEVSGNLGVLDFDNNDFATWLVPEPFGTWVTKTGSGKPHIFLRSRTPIYSSSMTTDEKVKLADIRGEGRDEKGASYVVAPPSMHPSGARYQTWTGSADTIREVNDANFVFASIRALFLKTQIHTNGHITEYDEVQYARQYGTRVLPMGGAADLAKAKKMLAEYGIVGKGNRHFIEGPLGDYPSRSEALHAFVCRLVEHRFDDDEIEFVVANLPIGEAYRDRGRGSYGFGLLKLSIDKARANVEAQMAFGVAVGGVNFRVTKSKRYEVDPPVYELTMYPIDDKGSRTDIDYVCIATIDDLYSQVRMEKQITAAMGIVPVWKKDNLSMAGFKRFTTLVLRMAEREEVPEVATTAGYLRGYIIDVLKQESQVAIGVPTEKEGFQLGFREPEGQWIYMRSGRLIHHITSSMRPPPSPEKVWGALRAMGSKETRVMYEGSGELETLWMVPTSVLKS